MRKEFIAIIYALMIVATIAGASATTFNFTLTEDASFKTISDNITATWNGTDQIIYFDNKGINATINTSPYDAQRFIEWGVTPADDSPFDKEDLFFINPETEELVKTSLINQNITTYNLSGLLPTAYLDRIRLNAILNPQNTLIISYEPVPSSSPYIWKIEDFNNGTFLGLADGCIQGASVYSGGSCGTITFTCGEVFVDYNGTGYDIYMEQHRRCSGTGSTLIVTRHHYDATGTLSTEDYHSFTNWGTNTKTPKAGFCYDDDDYIFCSRGDDTDTYVQLEKLNMSSYGSVGTIVYSEGSINALFADATTNNQLFVDNETGLRVAIGANLQNLTITTTYTEQFQNKILEEAIIYKYSLYDYTFLLLSDISNYTAPPPYTIFNNATTIANYTFTDLTSLELIGSNNSIIGNDEKIFIYDYNNPQIIIEKDNVTVGETIYETSTYSSNLMVGTGYGIYTYDKATLTQQYVDKWGGLFHPDKAYSIKTTSDTTAWVCDNNNEPDSYTAGSDPTGNLGTGCYDLEIDRTEQYLFVDTDTNGILTIDVSNTSNPTVTASIDDITNSHGVNYGDLLDYYDDADADLLVAITGELEFTVYDTSNKAILDEVVTCNSAGAGVITSVELINEEVAVAGTNNGRILFCDLTNQDYQTNTEWYTIEGMNDESVQSIDYDGKYIHAIGTTKYIIMSYEVETVAVNTPPNIQSYSVSDTTPDLNQDVVVDIVAGNVEPTDVIKYGVKCEGTESSYETNLEGSFTCNYNTSGTRYMMIAVTDNYHYPTFYDEKTIEITVSETNFSGGIITVEVSDPTIEDYIFGVQVEADNKSTTTNAFGRATLTVTEPISYPVTFTKTGYYTKVVSILANGDTNYVQLIPEAGINQSGLVVTVEDDIGNPIEGALVSYTHTTTYNYDYTWTDLNGKAYFADVGEGSVSLQASATNYDDQQKLVTISSYGTTTTTIVLPLLSEAYLGSLHSDRNCIDNGIWLCGESSIVEHSCTANSQCLSDQCTAGTNRCSRFNYSVCDEADMARDQRCVAKFTVEGGLNSTTNFMLTNLLWVVIILILLVAGGLVFMSWNK